MSVCPNCGSQLPDGAAFCDSCGAALGGVAPTSAQPAPTAVFGTCPNCGASVTPGEAFCEECGAEQGSVAPASSPVASGAGVSTCPNCGTPLEPGSNFCDMCGAPVSEDLSSPLPTPEDSIEPHQPAAAIQGRFVVEGTNATLPLPPGKTEILVGREDPVSGVFPDVDLTDHGGDEGGVSRKHARIFAQGAQIFIEDLNSTNYTYVNQQRLMQGQPHPLNSGDEVRFGRIKLIFYA